MIYFYGQIRYWDTYSGIDLKYYRMIAQSAPDISHDVVKPLSYRLLGPYIIGLLPIRDPLGFYIFSILFSIILLILFYNFLVYLKLSPFISLATTFALSVNKFFWGMTVWDYFQINDILTLIAILILFKATITQSWINYGIILAFAVIAKETSMAMILVTLFYIIERKIFKQHYKNFVLSIIPGVFIFIVLRLIIPGKGNYSIIEELWLRLGRTFSPEHWIRLLVYAFAPLAFLPLIFSKAAYGFIKKNKFCLFFYLLIIASTFITTDRERIMAPVYIVFYIFTALVLSGYEKNKKIIWLLLILCFVSAFHSQMGRFTLPVREWNIFLIAGTTLMASIIMFFAPNTLKKEPGLEVISL